MTKSQKKLWTGLFIMALLTPLGVLLPEKFKAGGAWGEWGTDKLAQLLGYVPEGLQKMSGIWKAPIPDYNLGGEKASMTVQVISYIVSGIIGIAAVALVAFLITRFIVKNEK